MQIYSVARSDVGRHRNHNEDFVFQDLELGLFVVCDGMGGHAAGEVASQLAATRLAELVAERRDLIDAFDGSEERGLHLRQLMYWAVDQASHAVFDLASRERGKHGMGTTCTALLVVRGKGFMAHVGDSRLYLVRDGVIHQLSEDHTYLNEAVKHGVMRLEDAESSPYAHMVTRAVGIQASVAPDTMVFDVVPGDTYLLASDGLHGYFEDNQELARFLSVPAFDQIADTLIEQSNERGGKDNISAVVLRAHADGTAPAADLARQQAVKANIETLRYIALFLDLDMRELVILLNAFRSEDYGPGAVVIREGDNSEGLFVIVEGALTVSRGGKRLAHLNTGSHFGEMALLSRRPRSASVVAEGSCRLLRLEREPFHELLRSEPQIGVKFLWKLAQILSLRLDELYLVQDSEANARRTLQIDVLSPFARKS